MLRGRHCDTLLAVAIGAFRVKIKRMVGGAYGGMYPLAELQPTTSTVSGNAQPDGRAKRPSSERSRPTVTPTPSWLNEAGGEEHLLIVPRKRDPQAVASLRDRVTTTCYARRGHVFDGETTPLCSRSFGASSPWWPVTRCRCQAAAKLSGGFA